MTFGLPPNLGSFAAMSPIVLDTLNFPGDTLKGPITDELFILIVAVVLLLL